MYYTYILKSKKQPGAIYIGSCSDLSKRLLQHNDRDNVGYTKRYRPWEIETFLAFNSLNEAESFEKYLKSSSGKAFMHKRLLSQRFNLELKRFNNGRKLSVTE